MDAAPRKKPAITKSLGALLAICLAGLQFLAVFLVVYTSYLTSERALLLHARDLLRDVGINTIEHSKGFLSPAEGAAELAARLAQNRVIASDDPQLLERLLFQQLQIAPQFAGIYFGSEDGNFVMVMRTPEGPGEFRSKIITHRDGKRLVQLIWRDDSFGIVEARVDPEDPYDPRQRPWYKKAKSQLTTIWTDPYIFFTSQQPGITLAAPVISNHEQGFIRGVVGVDIEISMISHFLSRLNIGQHGKALIIHSDGDVIAHPDLNLIKAKNEDGTLRFANIREFEDPIARAAFAPMANDGLLTVTEETPTEFTYDGQKFVATVMPRISDTLPWTIAVYAPEDDFTGVIKQNRSTNIWIAALVAAISGVAGLGLAHLIYKPVHAFAVRSTLIAQGVIDPADPQPRTYLELERANTTLVREIVARREAEREYGQTFDQSPRGMAQITSSCGAFTRVNASLCRMTGFEPDELIGKPITDMLLSASSDTPPQIDAPFKDFVGNREMRCRRKDGSLFWVAVNSIIVNDADGNPMHAVVTLDDITSSKEAEGQIVQLNRDLSHLARGNTMGQMATGLAHELNQPLTAIAQNADTALLILNQHAQPDDELHEILLEIEKQSLRAGEIIRALRAFIRKDAGDRSVFGFGELLDQSLRLVRAEATEANVTIESEIAPDVPDVEGNRVQIAQVIVNLLRNAIEAIADAGSNERRVTVRAWPDAALMTVSVKDTGPGISPAINLFAQFETSKPDGMGLGLSICRSIIEANGGALWLEDRSESGEGGAEFRFTLPLHRTA